MIKPDSSVENNLRRLWEQALIEDGADRDVTSLISVDEKATGTARLVARQPGIFAGQILFDLLAELYSDWLMLDAPARDSDTLQPGTLIATLSGPQRFLLGIERTLLNFLQRLCGVATLTRRYVDAVAGTSAKIYDTRKTIPGWRLLDKYAVYCGSGANHRFGLSDAVLIKDNHLADIPLDQLAARAAQMVAQAEALDPCPSFIEFEVDRLDQFDALLDVQGIDVILLDNFSTDEMREAFHRRNTRDFANLIALEASGGIDLNTVRDIAETGVDRISVGAITHSAPALDISMEYQSGR
ncbi:MAG: carboxylating nicotinate-nucleotide diphosphorylase [Phycisphaerales bacterium]|nr:carboxylating nicotinate-nucleotide diphosphorylase [Phycisphaerales bacterium]